MANQLSKALKKKIVKFCDEAMIYKTFDKGTDNERSIYVFNEEVIDQDAKDYLFNADFKVDDYHYKWLAYGLEGIKNHLEASSDSLDEFDENECADGLIDVYTARLTEWLASSNERVYFVTEVLKESDCKEGTQLLQQAQYNEICEIVSMAVGLVKNKFEVE